MDILGHAVLADVIALYVALVEQYLGYGLLHRGSGDENVLMLGGKSIADTGQHIGDGIGYQHSLFSSFRYAYQLALRTPGISPL